LTVTTPRDPELWFERLRRFDTPTVCNAIELFEARPRSTGFMDGSIKALFPELGPIVGFASTATFRSADAAGAGEAYSNIGLQVERMEKELPRPRIVVFQDLDERPCGATFGEVMCTAYQAFGCVGLITSGGGRDLEQVRKRGFACFAASAIASHAWCRIVDVHVPVSAGGLLVRPGDILHADLNGVSGIPRELVPEVALACPMLAEAEGDLLGYLQSRQAPTIEGLKGSYRRLRDRLGAMATEVRAMVAAGAQP
jgi:regulator of RNase E activity RraA